MTSYHDCQSGFKAWRATDNLLRESVLTPSADLAAAQKIFEAGWCYAVKLVAAQLMPNMQKINADLDVILARHGKR